MWGRGASAFALLFVFVLGCAGEDSSGAGGGHLDAEVLEADAEVLEALEAAAGFLADETDGWIEAKGCPSCHAASFGVWALREIESHSISIDPGIDAWWSFIENDLQDAIGRGATPEIATNRTDTLYDNLFAELVAQTGGTYKDDLIDGLLLAQLLDGTWEAQGQLTLQRRAIEETHGVSTLWAIHALRMAGADHEADQSALPGVAASLMNTGESTEAMAVRYLYESSDTALADLLAAQESDGGFGWLVGEQSDPMATGQALYALAFADPAVVGGSVLDAQAYLIAEQQENGSWVTTSTLEKNNFAVTDVSIQWGTAWAAIGLAQSVVPEAQ